MNVNQHYHVPELPAVVGQQDYHVQHTAGVKVVNSVQMTIRRAAHLRWNPMVMKKRLVMIRENKHVKDL